MIKNDIGYFSVPMGIYPRTLFIVKGKDKRKVIQDNFMARNGNDLIFDEDTTTRYRDWETDRKSTRLNSSHSAKSRMPSSA